MPRRGPPVAVMKVPRWYPRDVGNERGPRGFKPRGPLRGGPERPARDPQKKPRGGPWRGPERSAKEPRTQRKPTQRETDEEDQGERKKAKWPIVVTVDGDGHERKWGPLSRNAARRAGRFWEDGNGAVKVFLEKEETRKEVDVEKRGGEGRWRFWFEEKKDQPQQPKEDEEPASGKDDVTVVEEDTPEEIETQHKMWLIDKVTSLERENEEMKRALQEMATRVQLQENMLKQCVELQKVLDSAVTHVCESVQRLNAFTESASAAITGLVGDVQKHQDTFREVGRILQNHEERIAQTGVASQEMAQYINALIEESQKKTLLVGSLMRENQEQKQVLQRHEIGQHVLAEVIKEVANQQSKQQQQSQTVTSTGPTVTEVDEDRLDFLSGQNLNTGPPTAGIGPMTTKGPRALRRKDDPKQN